MSPTPRDNRELLGEWMKLRVRLTNEGMTEYQARKEIARRYETSVSTVYRWLNNRAAQILDSLTREGYGM